MHRFLTLAGILSVLALNLGAQTLAHCGPAETIAFFRQTEPLKSMDKIFGNSLFFNNPIDMQKNVLDQMDQGMGMLDGMLGMESGSLSTYIRSITLFEFALYRFEITDGMPDVDFALVLVTPMAEQIYKVMSGKLIAETLGEDLGNDETQVSISGAFGFNIGRKDDNIVVASDSKRLRDTMKSFGSSVDGNLANSARFKEAVGGSISDNMFYSRLDTWFQMLKDDGPRFIRRPVEGQGSPTPLDIMESLGIFKLAATAYVETDKDSRIAVTASDTMPLMDIFSASGGTPDLLSQFPTDTVFGIQWCGNSIHLWKKASAFFLDKSKFPFAAQAEAGIAQFQKEMNIKAEELAILAENGAAFGFIPNADGRLNDDPENFFLVLRPADHAKSLELLKTMATRGSEKMGAEVILSEDAAGTWLSLKRESERHTPGAFIGKDRIILSTEANVKRIQAQMSGQGANLGSVGALKGLKPGAAAYMFFGMKAIFGSERQFGPAYAQMKDAAGVAGAIEMTAKSMILTTNLPLGQVVGSFMSGYAMYEHQDEVRSAALQDLEKIAKAYREYRGKHNKNPKSLAELGLIGDKALSFPPNRPEGQAGKAYVLHDAPEVVGEGQEYQIVVVSAPDASLGRLIGTLNGDSRATSESQYLRMTSPK